MLADRSSRLRRPSRIAVAISAAPFVPKVSCAMVRASVSLPAFLILSITVCRASLSLMPASVRFTTAFFSPASATPDSTPFSSNRAMKLTLSSREKFSSLKVALFASTSSIRPCAFIPVSCAALATMPSRPLALSEVLPKVFSTLSALSTDETTSPPVILANCKKSVVCPSSSSPVVWKRVFTSPTALATSPSSSGMLVAIVS